ncbi:MAG TPA: cytochrome b/b6 domain-containing protein [Caulobacteraceae bacterium]|jgi:cytochrome b561|nr:cytochrome b/b6 domain-containing protein [Caulobacteraceae bacterium]
MSDRPSAVWDLRRYNAAAITLHWLLAALILIQIGIGVYMNEILPDHSPAQAAAEKFHISLGITIFLLVLLRIAIRLITPPPPLRSDIPPWNAALARFSHALFYVLMVVLPLTGWTLVSAGTHPISWWGIPWPHLPVASAFGGPAHKAARHTLMMTHTHWLIYIVVANLLLHIAGALKHQFEHHPVLWRMGVGAPTR